MHLAVGTGEDHVREGQRSGKRDHAAEAKGGRFEAVTEQCIAARRGIGRRNGLGSDAKKSQAECNKEAMQS